MATAEGGSVQSHEGFEEFAAARWPRLVRAAHLLGCRPSDAEDVAQSALVRCYVAWDRVQRADNMDAYVYRILVNAHRESVRKPSRREIPRPDTADTSTAEPEFASTVGDEVADALDRLPLKHRQVVVLRYYLQLSEHEMALALGVKPGTVKSRLSRALASLALVLRPTPREESPC